MKKRLLLFIALLTPFSGINAEELKTMQVQNLSTLTEENFDVEELTIEGANNAQDFSTLLSCSHLSMLILNNKLQHAQLSEIAHVQTLKELVVKAKIEHEQIEEGVATHFSSFHNHPALEKLHFEQDYQDPKWGRIHPKPGPSSIFGCTVKPKFRTSARNYIQEDLARVPNLKELRILHFSVNGQWHFDELQNLETLILMQPNWTTEGKEHFKTSVLPNLKKLIIHGYQDQKTCFRLKDPDLRGIDLYQVAPALEHVDLVKTQTTDEEIAPLANSTTLRYINLSQTAVTKDVVNYFADIPTLEEIHLNHVSLQGADFSLLADLPNLRILSIKSKMRLEDILTLLTLQQLEKLYIAEDLDGMIFNHLKTNLPNAKVLRK